MHLIYSPFVVSMLLSWMLSSSLGIISNLFSFFFKVLWLVGIEGYEGSEDSMIPKKTINED